MSAISFNNKLYPVGGTPSASMSVYDNSDSGLEATNVQDAIDELAEGGGGSGGHTIIDDTGTAVAKRSKLQFGDYDLTDDETNDVTKVNLVKPEEITWANYQQLTQEQKAGKQFYVPDYPSIGGVFFFQTEAAMQAAEATLPDNAVCIVWEDDPYVVTADIVEYDNISSGLEATNVQDAVDEVNSKVDAIKITNLDTDSDGVLSVPYTVTGIVYCSFRAPSGCSVVFCNPSSEAQIYASAIGKGPDEFVPVLFMAAPRIKVKAVNGYLYEAHYSFIGK